MIVVDGAAVDTATPSGRATSRAVDAASSASDRDDAPSTVAGQGPTRVRARVRR